ncbi:MAG: hypothetical protein GC201_11685 [Alphaproteobacteria bacterium]|nr:hypothetical protein [Alphaproteobacteria bacterium]
MDRARTVEDLDRAVRAIAVHFRADVVVIVGSQSVLLEWPDAPLIMRISSEIDAYPGNIREWEARHSGEPASEEIAALFGWGSAFHDEFGFYIDGVDETTARLPDGWQDRAIERRLRVERRTVKAIAPSPLDLAVSKLHRLDEKDRDYISLRHRLRPLDLDLLTQRLAETNPDPQIFARAIAFIDSLRHRGSPDDYP